MTSKKYVYDLTLDEALQKLDLLLYDRNCDIRVIRARQELIDVIRNETNKLKQDLEVLNILKQLAKGVIELKNNNIDITKYVVMISESTNEKIMRWLDGKD